MDDDLISIKAAAGEFGISRAKLWRWIKDGLLETYRTGRDGRVRLVRRDEVARLLRPHKEPTV